jgi:hypothetical protein
MTSIIRLSLINDCSIWAGFFLGDEVCCSGITVKELGEVASFIKARVPADVFTYVNECGHTFNRTEMLRRKMPDASMDNVRCAA